MKKFYLLGLALSIFSMAKAQTTVISDDFEARPVGSLFTGFWSNWQQADNADLNMQVVTTRASSGSKSGFIGPSNSSNGQDALLVMPEVYAAGTVTTSWKMFIPTDSVGYFNFQSLADPGGSPLMDCFINCDTLTLADGTSMTGKALWAFNDGTSTYVYAYAPITTNTWLTFKQVFNMDSSIMHLYVNDVEATYYYYGDITAGGNKWPDYPLKTVASVDFFSLPADQTATGRTNSYYVDDVTVTTSGSTGIKNVNKNSALITLYPNPSSDYVNLSLKGGDVMQHIEVYNVVGQKVLDATPNAATAQLKVQGFAAGVYSTIVTTKNGSFSKEFTVK